MTKDKRFHYKACGLPHIWLTNGFTVEDGFFYIEDIQYLHHAIGRKLVEKTSMLTLEEFWFLRTESELSRHTLAAIFGMKKETIKKWEEGNTPIPDIHDNWLRKLYVATLRPDLQFDFIYKVKVDEKDPLDISFTYRDYEWKGIVETAVTN